MKTGIPESVIASRWQRLATKRLTCVDGEPIEVVYPGRRNDGRGADFRDAVIATRRGLVKGQVEIHSKSSQWQAHGHHLDPTYNQTILHVILQQDKPADTILQNGATIPVVVLGRNECLSEREDGVGKPCPNTVKEEELLEWLDNAGDERFSAKADSFQAELAQTEAGQCLYQGIMVALGYTSNKLPFRELARRVPLGSLESAVLNRPAEEYLLLQQALLLGAAGLLPSQRPHTNGTSGDVWVDRLEKQWAELNLAPAMSYYDWQFFKVRPGNFPVRRIAAMCHLLLRYRQKSLLGGLLNSIESSGRDHRLPEKALEVTDSGYWAAHFDFGSDCRGLSPILLGGERAACIVVNVLLPFALAWARLNVQMELGSRAVGLYRAYPPIGSNAVERHMIRQLGINRRQVNSARRQQGLIHIYNTQCTQGRCGDCHRKARFQTLALVSPSPIKGMGN